MHNDKLEEAALCFNTVLNSNNEHIEALNNLSLILARWNNFEDAIFMANRAYEMASTQKKNELDNMCHDLEDHEDSSLSSTLLFIANNLCCFHLQIGDTNAVTKITEDVGSLLNSSFFQNHPLVDYNVSKLFLRTGNLTPYQSTITKAIDLYPDGMLWAALAEGFEAQRDVNFDDQEAMQDFNNKAIVTFEQAIQHSPNDPLLWNQIGVFYLRQEHYVSAKEAFETAIQLNSQYLNAWSNLALATHLEGTTELEKVESLYLKALLIDPRSVDTMLNFATLYRQHKKYEKATTLLRHCESLGPNNTLVLNNFGLLYQALGDVQQACRYFDKAQQIDPTFEPAKANKEKLSFKPS
jgi:tetratricopeptide (TPR) repeat protein